MVAAASIAQPRAYAAEGTVGPAEGEPWRGLHLRCGSNRDLARLTEAMPELVKMGMNVLILEVNHGFEFYSHPELRSGRDPITKDNARAFAKYCRELGVRLIPQFQCLGHQSWEQNNGIILRTYPELDETPGQYPNNEGIFVRSWCPRHPRINQIILPMIDEMIDAFEADAFHVGMDEVFIVGSEHCERCAPHGPAASFAKAVNDYHDHIVKKRGLEMLIWADRLIDQVGTEYTRYEASANGTAPALDMIPKDIILCDWHYYRPRSAYPSIDLFLGKGFRVWPSGWDELDSVRAFFEYAQARQVDGRMLGYLATTWGRVRTEDFHRWGPIRLGFQLTGGADEAYWKEHPIDEWQPPRQQNPMLRALANPPGDVKVLSSVTGAQIAAATVTSTGAWDTRGEPQDDPVALRIAHRQDAGQAGDHAEVTFTLPGSPEAGEGTSIEFFFIGRNFGGAEVIGTRFARMHVNGQPIWEQDTATQRRGESWVRVPLPDGVDPKRDLEVTFRVEVRQPGEGYGTMTALGPVRLVVSE